MPFPPFTFLHTCCQISPYLVTASQYNFYFWKVNLTHNWYWLDIEFLSWKVSLSHCHLSFCFGEFFLHSFPILFSLFSQTLFTVAPVVRNQILYLYPQLLKKFLYLPFSLLSFCFTFWESSLVLNSKFFLSTCFSYFHIINSLIFLIKNPSIRYLLNGCNILSD